MKLKHSDNITSYVKPRLSFLSYRVFCVMGDGETAEGSVWEAAAFSSYYKLDNLVAIVDVNRYIPSFLGPCTTKAKNLLLSKNQSHGQ